MKDPFQLISASINVADATGRITSAFYRMLMVATREIAGWGKADAPTALTVTASPYTFTAQAPGQVFITGGTVSAIKLVRGGGEYDAPASGLYVSPGDGVKVTYTVAPGMVFVPR